MATPVDHRSDSERADGRGHLCLPGCPDWRHDLCRCLHADHPAEDLRHQRGRSDLYRRQFRDRQHRRRQLQRQHGSGSRGWQRGTLSRCRGQGRSRRHHPARRPTRRNHLHTQRHRYAGLILYGWLAEGHPCASGCQHHQSRLGCYQHPLWQAHQRRTGRWHHQHAFRRSEWCAEGMLCREGPHGVSWRRHPQPDGQHCSRLLGQGVRAAEEVSWHHQRAQGRGRWLQREPVFRDAGWQCYDQ